VELRLRGANEVIVSFDERGEVTPAEVKARVVRLRIDLPLRTAVQKREQRLTDAAASFGSGRRGAIENRRKDIDELNRRADGHSRFCLMRQLDHQRDLELLAINEDCMFLFAMIAEAFAMIGEQDDQRLVVDTLLLQIIDELADD